MIFCSTKLPSDASYALEKLPAGNYFLLLCNIYNREFMQQFSPVHMFSVVFATMFYAAGKLRKNSVVETLKNENV